MKKFLVLLFIPLLSACVSHDLNDLVLDCKVSGPTLQLGSVTNATDCGTHDGSIQVIPGGGKQPYTFLLNNVSQDGQSFINLAAGVYAVGVRDANGCDTTITNITIMAQDFSFETVFTEDTECVGGNGAVTINVSEGNPPYTFSINGGSFSDSNTFTGLAFGTHELMVKDNGDCTIALNISVPRGATGTSWKSTIRPLIETHCALSGCHNGFDKPDLRDYAIAKLHAAEIKSLTQDRSMPFDGELTQNQIDIIACWVNDGALDN